MSTGLGLLALVTGRASASPESVSVAGFRGEAKGDDSFSSLLDLTGSLSSESEGAELAELGVQSGYKGQVEVDWENSSGEFPVISFGDNSLADLEGVAVREDVVVLLEQLVTSLEAVGATEGRVQSIGNQISELPGLFDGEVFLSSVRTLLDDIRSEWEVLITNDAELREQDDLVQQFDFMTQVVSLFAGAELPAAQVGKMMAAPSVAVVDAEPVGRITHGAVNLAGVDSLLRANVAQLTEAQAAALNNATADFVTKSIVGQAVSEPLIPGLASSSLVDDGSIVPNQVLGKVPKMDFSAQVLPREMITKEALSTRLSAILGDKVSIQISQKSTDSVATVRLDPPELGKVEVRIRLDADRVSVNIQASNAITRDALESSMERLRAELQSALGGMNVDVSQGDESRVLKWEQDDLGNDVLGTTEVNTGNELQSTEPMQEGVVAKA